MSPSFLVDDIADGDVDAGVDGDGDGDVDGGDVETGDVDGGDVYLQGGEKPEPVSQLCNRTDNLSPCSLKIIHW